MEYKGQLKGFPQEIVEKMLYYAEKSGETIGITLFEKSKSGGFTWADTKEGHTFWYEVIARKNFDLFFKRYPKKQHEVKYFKFELNNESRKALELINKKNPDKFHYGKSKYYYGADGSCLKGIRGLWVSNIISAEQMIEMLSEKKEQVKDEKIEFEMSVKYKNGNISDYVKYDEIMIRDLLINNNVESVIIQKKDPLFIEFKKIFEKDNTLTEVFNEVKKLFNK